ncbi:MAG: type I DNA topoisomerase [Muribaculaceae bacterium]|nr:type I DNA topoisomerase [Muribaculaceae bacterium]
MKNLVIVESPAKAKTIEKFLGPDYTVMSSFGHIRDLKTKGISIDFNNNFTPEYEVPDDKKDLVKKLRAAAADADVVWLASDEDREGEAIAWHLAEVLRLDPASTRRIVFHEITKPAIMHAIENPREIDIDRVNAQQARRVLDRIVGFELSPVLWKKIKPSLSAGRVQSVAVRLICERENEIRDFKTETYFRVTGLFTPAAGGHLKAEFTRRMADEKEAMELLDVAKDSRFTLADISVRPLRRSPLPPFTTSTLQQEASRRLGFPVSMTMRVAQSLYEAGHITYMRTDSLNLSELALRDIASTIKTDMGERYLHPRQYHTSSKGAQEAHEAIRPTYVSQRTIEGTDQERRLYDLIWRRAVASQMSDAEIEKTNADLRMSPEDGSSAEADPRVKDGFFRAEGEVVKFDGFMRVWNEGTDKGVGLPPLTPGESVAPVEITATQRFTLAPPRYTEAALVKKMEELGIGRPSTYAPTIHNIQERDYVRRGEQDGQPRQYDVMTLTSGGKITCETLTENTGSDKGKLVPTDIGMVVNEFLTRFFPDILDYNFTARVEEKFDEISEGKLGWQEEMADFYGGFHPEIEKINDMRMEHKIGERLLGTDPASGRPVSVKIGRFGPVAQIGEASDEEKPLFASLNPGQSLQTITLEEVLKLFELPRTVGEYEGEPIVAAVGRFGPYIRHKDLFVSIPKDMTPQGITAEEAVELISAKREAESHRHIKTFDEMPGLSVLNGRYGPYMAYKPEGARKAVNYKIPKDTDAASLTFEEAKALMEAQDASPAKKRSTRKTKK